MVPRRNDALLLLALPILVALLWVATAAAAPSAAPPVTPHPLDGRSDCLMCHSGAGASPMPVDHAGRGSATCVACHPAGGAAPAATTGQAGTASPGAKPTAAPPQPAAGAAQAPAGPGGKDAACLSCHQNAGPGITFGDGLKVSVMVDPQVFQASVHGQKGVACVDCHVGISSYPHPKPSAQTYREYSLASDQLCRTCHAANYREAQDSVHGRLIANGNRVSPSCTDCHGAHDVASPNQPRARSSQTCSKCHGEIYTDYSAGVHGAALLAESNQDVPVCTDCHGVHRMADPRTAEFRVESPDLCAKCHGDEQKMAKYGLSSRVTATYQREFHGVTATIYKTNYPTVWCYKAVCTDCHGVHNIRKTDDQRSSVYEDNLPATCGKCHAGATANFAAAWIGHYEPSPDSSPLVYYVNLFYQIVIPLVMVSLLSFIALETSHRLRMRFRAGKKVG